MAMAPEQTGIGIRRHFTTEGIHPYDEVVWEKRDARITNYRDGVVAFEQLESVAADVEEALRLEGSEASSARVGAIVLERLRAVDEVAYVRFASVYKGFEAPGDFEREVLALSQSDPPPPPPAPVD
jgi:transcriptional regulator NrdR family protein